MELALQIIDCVSTQDEDILTYPQTQMTLASHSNIGYLNKPEVQSRYGGHFLC